MKHSTVQPGQCLLGRYYIEGLLGEGGMGQVFLCHDSVRQGRYALKVIHPHLAPLEEVRRRFLQELKVTERLTHQGIVRTYSLEHHPASGLFFFTMEYLEGKTLEDILLEAQELQLKPPISLLETARILKELCEILTYAHAQGVIHRDIKPPNVMISKTGELKLMDFGIAKLLEDAPVRHTGFQGSVYYMAPEQLQGGAPVTPAADVFSLGILAYQLLTGEIPMGAVPNPSYYASAITSRVDDVVMRAIAFEAHKRHPTPCAFWSDLAKALQPILTLPGKSFTNLSNVTWPEGAEPVTWHADELLEPLRCLPVHPTPEPSTRVSTCSSRLKEEEYKTDREMIPVSASVLDPRCKGTGSWPEYGGSSHPRAQAPGDEATYVDFSKPPRSPLPKTSFSQESLSGLSEQYPVIRESGSGAGLVQGNVPSSEDRDASTSKLAKAKLVKAKSSIANLILDFDLKVGRATLPLRETLGSNEPTISARRDEATIAERLSTPPPHSIPHRENETESDLAAVGTFQGSGGLSQVATFTNKGLSSQPQNIQMDASKTTPESYAISSKHQMLNHASSPTTHASSSQPTTHASSSQPMFFTDVDDEILALNELTGYPEATLPKTSTHSPSVASLTSLPSSRFSSMTSLPSLNSVSYGNSLTTHSPSSTKFTSTSLPTLPSSLERKLIFSQRGDRFMEMVKIPAGSFLMGNHPSEFFTNDNECPQRTVYLDEYWIARTPITNQMWKTFVDESQYTCKDENYLKHWMDGAPPKDALEHPVVYISFADLVEFCSFYKFEIPSEAQWERAARGDQGAPWPWGHTQPHPGLCNFFESEQDTTTPVGMYPEGASPYGLLDCSGNAWEWCVDEWNPNWLKSMEESPSNPIYQASKEVIPGVEHSIRGGCYLYRASGVRCSFRYKSAKRAPYISARVIKKF